MERRQVLDWLHNSLIKNYVLLIILFYTSCLIPIDLGQPQMKEITWPDEDIGELINKMELLLPEKDSLAYRSRVEKLNWNEVRLEKILKQCF